MWTADDGTAPASGVRGRPPPQVSVAIADPGACGFTDPRPVTTCCTSGRTSTVRDEQDLSETTDSEQTAMSTDYSRALGARLRAIRNQQGLSLQGVEDKSHGRWKAVGVGSYERGDRAVTVQRLSELAVFYGVPVSELLPDPRPSSAVTKSTKIV